MALKLNVIIGSTRPGRGGPAVGQWVEQYAAEHGAFNVELVDLADFNLPLLDEASHPVLQKYEHEHTKRWSASVASADAYVFVTPEYDYFPPASLVNAVQVVMLEWGRKPVGVVSYGGISGGLCASQGLRLLVTSVNLHPLPQVVPIPVYAQFIGDDGIFHPNERMTEGATAMLNELARWGVALKQMRSDI